MTLTGIWKYNEDFGFGSSEGRAELIQSGETVTGTFTFTEQVKNDYKINVVEEVKGKISGGKVVLKSTGVHAEHNGLEIDYLPNTFEIFRSTENKLVGSTFDSENVCGVFVLERIDR